MSDAIGLYLHCLLSLGSVCFVISCRGVARGLRHPNLHCANKTPPSEDSGVAGDQQDDQARAAAPTSRVDTAEGVSSTLR